MPGSDSLAIGVTGNAFMTAAVAAARRALLAGEAPIGASLVRDGRLIATSANSVIGSVDVTAHAEINALREATKQLRALTLEGCDLYVTVEPCAMCLGASHYAGIARIFYGAAIADLNALTGNEFAATPGGLARRPRLQGGIMREEALQLLVAWDRTRGRP